MPRKTSPTHSTPNNSPVNPTQAQQHTLDPAPESQPEFDRQLAEAKAALTPPAIPLHDRIYWDWPGWLPAGFLTILASAPGVGKSFLALRIAASYLDGRPWPDATRFTGRHDKILWCEGESGHLRRRPNLDRSGPPDLERLLGSPILARAARVVWVLDAPDPADPDNRRLSMVKNNLAPLANPIGFRIGARGLHFGPPPQSSPATATQSEEDRAVDFLKDLLANGPLPANQIKAAAQAAAISGPTLKRAKRRLRVKSNKLPDQWTWELPPE